MPRPRLVLALAVLAVTGSLVAGPPSSATDVLHLAAVSAPSDAPGLRTTEVTLLTGDRVLIAPAGPDGPPYELRPARRLDGSTPSFSTTWDGDALYVIPTEVAPYVDRLLDRELFNVTALAAMQYDDRSTDRIPLVLATDGASTSGTPSLEVGTAMPTLGLAAASLPKASTAALRDDLADGQLAGITYVWLDRRVEAAGAVADEMSGGELDHNLVQIDAPAAWDAGLSGDGVRVAVLDTGVDADHPDLVDQVAAAKNFSESPTVDDVLGFGTHTAALIAGTGAAAGGARKGVAFGAEILSAKVLGDQGFGQESWVLAGLEWAIARNADVINIGFNGYPGPATDPITLAIDQLVAETGTTVVVPSGDLFFPEPFTIASPGAARLALTVGAAAPDDTLAGLSGRGPTYEYGLKPDLLAPGVDIVAAVPGNNVYATRTATAAAAAHASGAAALLIEQHPDWTTDQVRAALVGNAVELDDLGRDEQGGGRLDLGLATTEPLVATPPLLDFGLIAYPHEEGAEQTITMTNEDDVAHKIKLELELIGPDGTAAPDGLAALDDTTLTIPAGRAASTDLVIAALDLSEAPSGRYEGAVRITGAGGVSITMPVGLYREPERYDLRVQVIDASGEPFTAGGAEIFNKETFTRGFFPYEELGPDGEVTVRVAPGWYSATSQVTSPDGSLSITAAPEVHVTTDTEVVLDARKAKRIGASLIGTPADLVESHVHYSIADEEGRSNYWSFFPPPSAVRDGKIRATPTDEGTHGAFHFVTRWALLTDAVGAEPPALFELVYQDEAVPDPPTYVHDPDDTASVQRFDETYRGVGSKATLRSYRAYASDVIIVGVGQFRPLEVPSRRVEHVLATPGVYWLACVYPHPTAPTQLCGRDGEARAGLSGAHRWLDVVHPNPGLLQRWDATTLFTQMGLGDGGHKGLSSFEPWKSTTLALYDAEGTLIEREESDFAYFPVEPGPGTYTLEHVAEIAPGHGSTATSATTRWTFHTEEPNKGEFDLPGFLDVGYRPDTDGLGRAEAGRGLRLGVRAPRGNEIADPAEITTARTWVSADDGASWVKLTLREPDDGRQRFLTRVPRRLADAGVTLSLRVKLVDAAGRTLEQTLVGALPVV